MTVNLGPTFLSGALAANAGAVMDEPSCPLVQGPYRHYVLNAIWILINLLCIMLTIYHLRKLYRDFTKSNIEALRVHRLFSAALKEDNPQVNYHYANKTTNLIPVYQSKLLLETIVSTNMKRGFRNWYQLFNHWQGLDTFYAEANIYFQRI